MESLHDNGRVGDQPDLRDLIDHAGAAVAATSALVELAERAASDLDGTTPASCAALLSVANDADEARLYLTRLVRRLRELV